MTVLKADNPDIDLEVKALMRLFETDLQEYWGEEGMMRREKLSALTDGRHPMCNPVILEKQTDRKRYLTDPSLDATVNYKVDVSDSDSATIWSRPKVPRSKVITHKVDFQDVRDQSRRAYLESQKKPTPFSYDVDYPVPVLSFPAEFVRQLDSSGRENLLETMKTMYRQDILKHIGREVREFTLVEKELKDKYATNRYGALMKGVERAVYDAMKRVNDNPDYVPFDLADIRDESDPIDVPKAIAQIFEK